MASLRLYISECEFVSTCDCKTDISNIFLRTRFIRGINDNAIREQMLQSGYDDFDKLFQKALSLDAFRMDSRELSIQMISTKFTLSQQVQVAVKVNPGVAQCRNRYVQSQELISQPGIRHLCIRCGRDNHKTKDCRTDVYNLKCEHVERKGMFNKFVSKRYYVKVMILMFQFIE